MQKYNEWKIKNSFCPESEIYFLENTFVGIKDQSDAQQLPGRTIYKVVDNDLEENTVVLTDQEGNRYKFNQDELAKALAEDASMTGWQALQYPLGAILATSGTDLSKLSIYDPRLKVGKKLKEKDISKAYTKDGKQR